MELEQLDLGDGQARHETSMLQAVHRPMWYLLELLTGSALQN
jgi:hypothetical protein